MNRPIFDWPLIIESSRNWIKRIVSKFWTAALILYFSTRGTAVQIWKAIRFFLLREDSFTRGQSPISVTGHWGILSNVLHANNKTIVEAVMAVTTFKMVYYIRVQRQFECIKCSTIPLSVVYGVLNVGSSEKNNLWPIVKINKKAHKDFVTIGCIWAES